MANKKISQLTEVTNPNATDVIPVVNASETKKTQLGNLPISDATQSALDGKQDTLGYTAENVANRSTDVDADKTSLTKYPVVKAVYDWAVSLFATISQLNTKQDTLVSGTNIKTINSTSLLGSGDIAIGVDLSPISVDGDKVSIAADSTATTQTTAVIQATDTNSSVAIVPNGTGAFTLDVPDGTATGGNARGQYAVDLQMFRGQNIAVASGEKSFVVGQSNTASGDRSIAMGNENQATAQYSIAIGQSNQATSRGAVALGGYAAGNVSSSFATFTVGENNTASNQYCSVSGGQSNTASTNTHATVVGGYQNSSTGQYSISGGYSNVASGLGSVALGYDNTASGTQSFSVGRINQAIGTYAVALGYNNNVSSNSSFAIGTSNTVSNLYSFAYGINCVITSRFSTCIGFYSYAYLQSQLSYSSGRFSATGDSQESTLVSRKEDTLTTGATTTLSLDGTGTTNLIIPDGNNRVWNVTVKYTAVVTNITGTATGVNVGDCKNEVLTIGFKKIGGTSSVVGSLNTLSTNEDSSMSTASFGVTAGASQEMKLDFTAPTFSGGGSVTTRVVAKVELTEVAY